MAPAHPERVARPDLDAQVLGARCGDGQRVRLPGPDGERRGPCPAAGRPGGPLTVPSAATGWSGSRAGLVPRADPAPGGAEGPVRPPVAAGSTDRPDRDRPLAGERDECLPRPQRDLAARMRAMRAPRRPRRADRMSVRRDTTVGRSAAPSIDRRGVRRLVALRSAPAGRHGPHLYQRTSARSRARPPPQCDDRDRRVHFRDRSHARSDRRPDRPGGARRRARRGCGPCRVRTHGRRRRFHDDVRGTVSARGGAVCAILLAGRGPPRALHPRDLARGGSTPRCGGAGPRGRGPSDPRPVGAHAPARTGIVRPLRSRTPRTVSCSDSSNATSSSISRSTRPRLDFAGSPATKRGALRTLVYLFRAAAIALAPIAPFTADTVHRRLLGEPRSLFESTDLGGDRDASQRGAGYRLGPLACGDRLRRHVPPRSSPRVVHATPPRGDRLPGRGDGGPASGGPRDDRAAREDRPARGDEPAGPVGSPPTATRSRGERDPARLSGARDADRPPSRADAASTEYQSPGRELTVFVHGVPRTITPEMVTTVDTLPEGYTPIPYGPGEMYVQPPPKGESIATPPPLSSDAFWVVRWVRRRLAAAPAAGDPAGHVAIVSAVDPLAAELREKSAAIADTLGSVSCASSATSPSRFRTLRWRAGPERGRGGRSHCRGSRPTTAYRSV